MPLRVALLGVGVALGLWARALAASASGLSFASRTSWGTIFLLIAGWSAMVAAVIVLRERRRCALLLYAVGTWWFVRELATPSVEMPLVFTSGLVLFPVGPALVAHLLLSYPTGRIQGWPYRVIVACGYAVTLGILGLASTIVFDPAPIGCVGCPDNLLLIHADLDLFDRLNLTGVRLGAVWLILALGAGAWRVISAKPGSRSSISLVAPGAIVPRGERRVLPDQPAHGSAGRQWPGSRCLAGSGGRSHPARRRHDRRPVAGAPGAA